MNSSKCSGTILNAIRQKKDVLMPNQTEYSVYILRCEDGSLYTGIARDVFLRFQKHVQGKGAAYTRSRKPVEIVFFEEGFSRSQALQREYQIKALPTSVKRLVVGV